MGKDSKIAWTDHTFNPWWGCTKISAGCKNCYAEGTANRFGTIWGDQAERRFFGDKHWNEPRKWDESARKAGTRARVFCCSMADVFEDRDDLKPHRERLWELVEATPNLIWLLLTKRPENLRNLLPTSWLASPRSNVAIGVTVECQDTARERIPELLQTPAAVRFISAEPLLSPLSSYIEIDPTELGAKRWRSGKAGYNYFKGNCALGDCSVERGPRIDWIIVGGESGPRSRPCHVNWIRSIVIQCKDADVPCFVKQLGANPRFEPLDHVGKSLVLPKPGRPNADPAEWPTDLAVREFPKGQS